MNDSGQIRGSAEADTIVESAVLQQVLALHPIVITLDELLLEIEGEGETTFAQRDAVERAVRDLAAAGLVHRRDSFVLPSRAALRFDELLGE
ncbi:MAG TPA: hypothetical protein VFT10_07395 [Solirubrobacterales bacterium]|nr:hypothetical protein [Solirubrobacterales bacterium]